ncbi:Hypothetical protein UVM_LOCUS96 [uncultured virus]|nr:Hypothetical protein UVM_LOCUS96 [uncultured virus]
MRGPLSHRRKLLTDPQTGNPVTLYRVGDPATVRGFWSDQPDYYHDIMWIPRVGPRPVATVANVRRSAAVDYSTQSANADEIEEAAAAGYDAVVFPHWDYEGNEWVVINPAVLIRQ